MSPFLISLTNAKDSDNNTFYKVIINGNIISEIIVKSAPIFEPKEFADIVVRSLGLRQSDVRVYEEAGVVVVSNSIRVTEAGVEGSGPLAQKVYDVYNAYISKKKESLK